MERGSFEKGLVEKSDFLLTNTRVLGKQSKWLTVSVKLRKVHHVLIYVVKSIFLGSGCEKNACISALNGVFTWWGFIVWSWSDFFDIAERERLEKTGVKINFSSWDFITLKSRCSCWLVRLGLSLSLFFRLLGERSHWYCTNLSRRNHGESS